MTLLSEFYERGNKWHIKTLQILHTHTKRLRSYWIMEFDLDIWPVTSEPPSFLSHLYIYENQDTSPFSLLFHSFQSTFNWELPGSLFDGKCLLMRCVTVKIWECKMYLETHSTKDVILLHCSNSMSSILHRYIST